MSSEPPAVGDILSRNGDNWEVQDVTEGADGSPVVTLRPLRRLPKPEVPQSPRTSDV
jgi:hypothetical protein